MNRILSRACVIAMAFLPGLLFAQHLKKPAMPVTKTSFAVFVDARTYKQCEKEINDYKQVLEEENLPTFVLYGTWKNPEQVKKEIVRLYHKNKLEGVVFIGDVPVAMIQKAQQMTSAFKMDESRPRFESSVPSDRFYDDLDLKFDYAGRDSAKPLFFYYDLAADSPQRIQCDLYSGRIKPINNGVDKYEQVRRYLTKAVAEHRSGNKLNQFVSYTGEGSYSNSLSAWAPECFNVREQFPGVFDKQGSARFLRYSMNAFTKEAVLNQIRREDLDLMIFHEHGMPERQYISGAFDTKDFEEHIASMKYDSRERIRREVKNGKKTAQRYAEYATKYGLDSTWFGGYDDPKVILEDSLYDAHLGILLSDVTRAAPNARFVIFDACYNGDFREDDNIAARYIFSDGKSVVAFANTVNVLQDKSANDMLGLLGLGARIGQWARYVNILESHIIGDPTIAFRSNEADVDVKKWMDGYQESEQLRLLETSKFADVQNLALCNLYCNQYSGISGLLLKTFKTSSDATVRYNCLNLLEKAGGDNFYEVLKLGSSDSYEFIRRIAVSRMGRVGRPDFLPYLIQQYIQDACSERVVFNVLTSLRLFAENDLNQAIEAGFKNADLVDKEKAKASLLLKTGFSFIKEMETTILDKKEKEKKRMFFITCLKNINYHPDVDRYVSLLKDSSEMLSIRLAMLDALAWFDLSYRKNVIEDACLSLTEDKTLPEKLRVEALRTYNRLKN